MRKHFRAAFTLIELMIVIGLIAIIAAAGVPAFVNALKKEGLRKAVSDLVEGCSTARAQAILHGVPTEFVLRAENGQMSVRALQVRRTEESIENGGSSEATTPANPGAAISNFKGSLPDNVAVKWVYVNFQDQMEFPEAHVRFFPNGTCDEFTVILSSASGEQKISLDVITGLADVQVLR